MIPTIQGPNQDGHPMSRNHQHHHRVPVPPQELPKHPIVIQRKTTR